MKKPITYHIITEKGHSIATEPFQFQPIPSGQLRKSVAVKDFTFAAFKKIADKAPFTIREWADFLHISERTLQRYAKENTAFNGLQIERILLFKILIESGNKIIGKANFKQWLLQPHFATQFKPPFSLLFTHEGVQEVIDILGRIEHGITP